MLLTSAGPALQGRLKELELKSETLSEKLSQLGEARKIKGMNVASGSDDNDRLADREDRRVRLDSGGGFIPAFLWTRKDGFKNESLAKVFKLMTDADTWCDVSIYTSIASINSGLFRWMRPRRISGRLVGERRVQLVNSGVQHVSDLYSTLANNDPFILRLGEICKSFLQVSGRDISFLRVRVQQYAERLKKQFLARSEFLRQPPTVLAVMAAPLVRCSSLGLELESIIPDCQEMFASNPLFRHGCPVLSEEDTKLQVRFFVAEYDRHNENAPREDGSNSGWRHPISHLFFAKGGELRMLLDLYTEQPGLSLVSCELRHLRRKLIEMFVVPPMTTQEIEGVHGTMTNINRNAPRLGLKKLAIRLSQRLNYTIGKEDYVEIQQSRKAEVAAFTSKTETERRHRTDKTKHIFWKGELTTQRVPPVVSAADKVLWIGSHADNNGLAELEKLVRRILEPQVWYGRRRSGTSIQSTAWLRTEWREIFRLVPSDDADLTFEAVDKTSKDMQVDCVRSFQIERFIGQSVNDLEEIDLLAVSVSDGNAGVCSKMSFDEDDGCQSLFEYRSQLLSAGKRLSAVPKRELAWLICQKYKAAYPTSQAYASLLSCRISVLKHIWTSGGPPNESEVCCCKVGCVIRMLQPTAVCCETEQ